MSPGRRLWLHLGMTLLVLGPSAGASLLFGPQGFKHYHDSERERHAHSHVHAGAHRHDVDLIHSHDHAPPSKPKPEPERDDDTPEGRFVPAAGPAMAHRVAVVESFSAPEPAGLITLSPYLPPRRQRFDLRASPRGPPA